VELRRTSGLTRKLLIAAIAIFAFLGVAAATVWLLASFAGPGGRSADATPTATAAQQGSLTASPPAAVTTGAEPAPASAPPPYQAPQTVPSAPPATTMPRNPSPAVSPAPAPPAPPGEGETSQPPAATPAPEETAAETESPAEEAPPVGQARFQALQRLSFEIDAKTGDLVDKYREHLRRKEDGGNQLTKSDEQLKDALDAFQDAAVTFRKQFEVGRWGRMFGHRADDQRKTRENSSRLTALISQVEMLMNEARPGPEVRKAWIEVRRRSKRVGMLTAGL
jgi:hypothetical protein